MDDRVMKMMVCFIWIVLVAGVNVSHAKGQIHTRVILDTSYSMQDAANDPNRLAKLSAAMLFDLTNPNVSVGDTFKIIPFEKRWKWKDPSLPPPEAKHGWIIARKNGRKKFLDQVKKVTYTSMKTFFYPPLLAAINDLKGSPGGNSDVRTIVMVTDGVPDWKNEPVSDSEPIRQDRFSRAQMKIKTELVPLMEKHNIHLYIIAFGTGVSGYESFFRTMTKRNSIGKFFTDKDGKNLLRNMVEIFSISYGYVIESEKKLPGVREVQLNRGDNPDRVAVVVISNSRKKPGITLKKGKNTGKPNYDGPVKSHNETKNSYSLRWFLSPEKGYYKLSSNTLNGSLAILKPAPVKLEILPDMPKTNQINRTMASENFNLRIFTKSVQGGDPGPLNITIEYDGPRTDGTKWVEKEGHKAGSDKPVGKGRSYAVAPKFKENESDPGEVYRGHISVFAKRGNAIVGDLQGNHSHDVEVWPFLSLHPMPSALLLSQRALAQRQTGCANFRFIQKGHFPNVGSRDYRVSAILSTANNAVLTGELHRATFTLNGLPLNFENTTKKKTGPWYSGHSMSKETITGEHKLCATLGKPKTGDPNTPVNLKLQFTLHESPYDDFKVVNSLDVKLRVLGPSLLDRSLWYMLPVFLLFGCCTFFWYTRKRPFLSDDLCYSIGSSESTSSIVSLGKGSQLPVVFGFVEKKTITTAEGQDILASVVPTDENLFFIRTEKGISITSLNGDHPRDDRGKYLLEVGRTYKLSKDQEEFFLRMEYR